MNYLQVSRVELMKKQKFTSKLYSCFCILNGAILIILLIASLLNIKNSSIFKILSSGKQPFLIGKNAVVTDNISQGLQEPVPIKSVNLTIAMILEIFNHCGKLSGDYNAYYELQRVTTNFPAIVQDTILASILLPMQEQLNAINLARDNSKFGIASEIERKGKITLGSVVCGDRWFQLIQFLKSAVMFSQDVAQLHMVVFVDKTSALNVGLIILTLKWMVQALKWKDFNFTFELHMESFPANDDVDWKNMYAQCATQRLFFPSLLPHIDSLIYLDTDTLVVSNLSELWSTFGTKMRGRKLAAAAANSEDSPLIEGWYHNYSEIPYYGSRGLNAGVLLMNLTKMRRFDFEGKSVAAQRLYHEKMYLADQDIINIIFHTFPEKVWLLDCSYNFNWIHCGTGFLPCPVNATTGESPCFCKSALRDGVKIVHGNSNGFYNPDANYAFLPQINNAFEKFDLLRDSPISLFQDLKINMGNLNPRPCYPLTPDILYNNALKYFDSLKSKYSKQKRIRRLTKLAH